VDYVYLGLALGLPWVTGVAWIRWILRAPANGAWPFSIGAGYLAGMMGLTLMMRGMDALGMEQSFWVPLLVLAWLCAIGLWWPRGGRADAMMGHPSPGVLGRASNLDRAILCVIFALCGFHLALYAVDIFLRPLFPWDAWSAWAPRAKVWMATRHLNDFIDPEQWFDPAARDRYALDANHYPPTIPLLQLWISLALGYWNDVLVNLPWLLCGIALVGVLYGQLRLAGIHPIAAALCSYAVISLPIVGTHIALAGYADLWLASLYCVAATSTLQWIRTRDPAFIVLAILFALAVTQIKIEGVIWSAVLVGVFLRGWLTRGWLIALAIFAMAILAGLLLMGGISTSLPYLGELVVRSDRLVLPGMGTFVLEYHPVWISFWNHWAVFANWHLFWWLCLGIVLFALLTPGNSSTIGVWTLFLQLFGILWVIFFFSEQYRWAEWGTAINRVTLHVVPTLVFGLALLVHSRIAWVRDREPRSSVGHPASGA
jgi:hypothetical protein